MSRSEKILWPPALKKTAPRLLILDAFCASDKPLTAPALSALLERQGTPVWLSTVYRVLDLFSEHGILIKTALHENGMAIYELNDGHRHYAVCVACKRVIAMHGCPLESFMPDLQEKNFHILGHKLQMYGYCGECYRAD